MHFRQFSSPPSVCVQPRISEHLHLRKHSPRNPQRLPPRLALRVEEGALAEADDAVALSLVVVVVVVCRGVERRAVVPDREVVERPGVADLKVVVLGDVAREEGEDIVGLVKAELDDALGEAERESKYCVRGKAG